MKKTLVKGLALAVVGGLMMAGSAMALPSDYFTPTDFTTGLNGTVNFTLLENSGSAGFGMYWVDDINAILPVVTDTLGITFGGVTNIMGQADFAVNGSLWDVTDHFGSTTTTSLGNVFGFYFDDGSKHYTDTTLSGADVTVIADTNSTFVFKYGDNTATVAVYADDLAPVPEPATMLLLGTGLIGLAGVSRRKKSNKA